MTTHAPTARLPRSKTKTYTKRLRAAARRREEAEKNPPRRPKRVVEE